MTTLITVAKCLRTVWVDRIVQEPRTAYSGALGFAKFSVKLSMHLDTMDGHLFIIFRRLLLASLVISMAITSEMKICNM